MVETQADEADETTEDEAMNAKPSYAEAGPGTFGEGGRRGLKPPLKPLRRSPPFTPPAEGTEA